jgi:dihydroxyacetone kinase
MTTLKEFQKITNDDIKLVVKNLSVYLAKTFDKHEHAAGLEFRIYLRPNKGLDVCIGWSDYDQDHRGFCGASSVYNKNKRDAKKEVIYALEQILEQFYEANAA